MHILIPIPTRYVQFTVMHIIAFYFALMFYLHDGVIVGGVVGLILLALLWFPRLRRFYLRKKVHADFAKQAAARD
jgi:hypothetical protein